MTDPHNDEIPASGTPDMPSLPPPAEHLGAGPTLTSPARSFSARVPLSTRELPPPERRSLMTEDLTGDKLLRPAPRVLVEGRPTPALGGIPLLAKLGQGGMGAVYYGVHPRLRKEVAVKVLPFHLAEADPALIARFRREAQASAQVESPHLVRVLDVNEERHLHYIVMEFVRGVSGGKYIKQLSALQLIGLPEAQALETCLAAARGLAAAHDQGVVHRDVKPENILIPYAHGTSVNADASTSLHFAHAKVSDLGLARHQNVTQPITSSNATMGSPGFMAPEQIDDAHQAGPTSDIFALGASLYCFLAGHPPFRGDSAMQIMRKTATQPPEPLEDVRPDVSPATREIINRCLEKDPKKRFQSAADLASAIADAHRLIPPSGDEPARDANPVFIAETVRSPKAGATNRTSTARWLVAAVLLTSLSVLAYFWMEASPADTTGERQEAAWRMTVSRVNAAKFDLPKAEKAYAEFISQFPLSDHAQEASKRRAELDRRIEDARQALLNNLPLACAAREKGQWVDVTEFLEIPLRDLGSLPHPNREKAAALLEEARSELRRRESYATKVKEADELLKREAFEQALKTYQAAEAEWPEAGPNSAAAEGIKRSRQGLLERQSHPSPNTGR